MKGLIIQCKCNKSFYTSGSITKCPVCKANIVIKNEEPYVMKVDELEPLMRLFMFEPSYLRYFTKEYPEEGQSIVIINGDRQAFRDIKWSPELLNIYEDNFYNLPETNKMFSWISLDKEE